MTVVELVTSHVKIVNKTGNAGAAMQFGIGFGKKEMEKIEDKVVGTTRTEVLRKG